MLSKNQKIISDEVIVAENLVTINTIEGKTRNTISMQTASNEEKVLPTTKLY